jgi:hypothetical protein
MEIINIYEIIIKLNEREALSLKRMLRNLTPEIETALKLDNVDRENIDKLFKKMDAII